MQHNEKTVEILNDLVKINNDRIEGYRKAVDQSDDADLKALFQRMIDESQTYVGQLNKELAQSGNEPESGTTTSGKLYRTWMDVKATFTGSDRHSILSSCEYGEDAAQRAYDEALKSETPMPYDLRELIANQKGALKNSHDTIKTYRDVEKVSH
ncbi:PA2169 family four-helix-bundle protein [Chitinophaga pendula]|uniref:ferritin-like domain-containing protein n=1 Tax=Chitinophaga TaxID=79328 RepID=UPI000BAFD822|nr:MULTISPECIES: PA2169 family four-helix-bundle protein [Chitinophaga]ASZ10257.1 aldehyde dehydrogenase [Chitinophaga sp. MD30]UCJ06784.1 PA2169 family four-helix-bundle protein [Chitinophaga pendula]